MTMFSSDPHASPDLVESILNLLKSKKEMRLDKLCQELNCTFLSIPWGINPPFYCDFRKDGFHWVRLRNS